MIFNNSHQLNILHNFSKEILPKNDITDQKKSGRCWVFSFLNMIRYPIIKKFSLPKDFQFSQTYLYFYDKLEKSLYFLQNIVATSHYDIESRVVDWLLSNPVIEGGTWNMVENLIQKYGIVPKSAMPETYQTENTTELNRLLYKNLKRVAMVIRKQQINGEDSTYYIQEELYNIYRILVYFMGSPPVNFTWGYENQLTNKIITDENITPIEFSANYLQLNVDNWVVCGNYPLDKYPFYKIYNVEYCNNMVDGIPTRILNLPIEYIEKFTKNSIDNNTPVWVAIDNNSFYNCQHSTLDTNVYDYSELNFKIIDKGSALEYGISAPNHAVIIIGYNINEYGNVDRWLIENSHGNDDCKVGKSHEENREGNGYITMTNEWFKKYLFEIVIYTRHIPNNILQLLNDPPVQLNPWGSIGNTVYCV